MKNKKKATTPTEPEPKPSKGKKKSSSREPPPPPPPVRAPVNGSKTAVKQPDPVVTVKPTIPDEADFNLPQHTPSYVGISCAILGYGLYNRYNGSPGPSLQISSQQIGGTSQVSDELDSSGPVTRLIAQFEALKKEQAAKAAAEYQALRSLEEAGAEQGDLIPTLSSPSETHVKKYPPVITTETNRKSDEKIIQTTPKKPEAHPPQVLEGKRLFEEKKTVEVVREDKIVAKPDVVEEKKEIPVKNQQRDEIIETRVAETLVKHEELRVNEDVVVAAKSPEHLEQIAVVENITSEEDQEDVSLILSESKSDHSQLVLTSQSPVFEDRSESDTGSVRIHDTPEPFESHHEFLFDTQLQSQQSPSPLLQAQSPEREIMKQEFLENAQIVGHSEEETVEDELSTRVQVSDSNEEALMREAPVGSTSSRKTSIESDGSNEVLVRDGKWFLSQYELVCDEVRQRVTQAESDLETFSNQMNDDVEGRVRAGVGKANLLITSKLKQFHDLCIKNIENSMNDGFETKIEDLEGFWEMVSYQIEDVHHTFDEIESMRQNNWTVVPEAEIQHHEVSKAKPTAKKSSTSSVTAENDEAAAAKEEARRARLREAKRLQANKLAAAANEDVIIFAPSADETVSSPSPVISDPIVQTETQELIEIESSTLISVPSERLPQRQESAESVPVDLLS